MSDSINFVVQGDRQVGLRFEEIPQNLHVALKDRITEITAKLYARVLSRVPRRTGKLASEIEQRVSDSKVQIVGAVFVSDEFAKAAAEEYGAHAAAKVSSYDMRLDHVFARRLASPISVRVGSHKRLTNITARRFLRDAEGDLATTAVAELQQTVAEGIAET